MISQKKVLIFLGLFTLLPEISVAQERSVDQVTQQLFEQYIVRRGKINGESIIAATHLVAERGRRNGFWKNVLAELKRNNEHSEVGCVRVLGKMLATDAAARDVIRRRKETGEISAWAASIRLGPEVVTGLLERARQADRYRIDHYTIALARARVPEAKQFFQSILRATVSNDPFAQVPSKVPASQNHLDSTRYHAAVGLAQLGEFEGIDWLIANSEYSQGTVVNAWPRGARRGGGLSTCCVEALRYLSGERGRTSKADWAAWRKTADKKSLRDHAVVFGDP